MIQKIENKDKKETICLQILEALPEWFEIPESRRLYAKECREIPLWADIEDNQPRGFVAMRETSKYSVEIYVMGVRKEYQRLGIGSRLFEVFYKYASEKQYEYIQVKTVREGMYPDYDLTNHFYQKIGFRELECIEESWDEANPCQIYIMAVNSLFVRGNPYE